MRPEQRPQRLRPLRPRPHRRRRDPHLSGTPGGSPGYGAKPMGVGGAVDPITHATLAGSSGHNEYFTAGTECMRNLAMIGIDRGELVIGR
ncbi:MAG: hypothetical protein JF618_01530 [Leifsonia sp.]|nr:hypothetical protein [Leifsonia sp.]